MGKIAFVFPGQGAQKIGMGKEFYDSFACSRAIFDRANEILDLDVKALCFEENDRLNRTEYTQCALVTTELAILAAVREVIGTCEVTGGLSLGEYSALAAAGALSNEDAIYLVRKRGILMEQAVPAGQGAMTAVLGMEASKIEEILSGFDGVEIANYNCPGQIVISGRTEAVAGAAAALSAAGAKRCVPLKVSGPFHSSLLGKAGEALAEELSKVRILAPQIPYTANVTGAYVTEQEPILGLLKEQVSHSVRWQQCVETMIADGVDTFLELGPQKTLTGFLKKIDRSKTAYSIETLADLENTAALLKGGNECFRENLQS